MSCNSAVESKSSISKSEGIKFQLSYQSTVTPLPLNSIHSWVLQVKTVDGIPVEKANILVYGGMPAHKHGLPTSPKVTEIGDGEYLIEGIKFSMTGKWIIWFEISKADSTDTIKVDIEL